MSISDLVKKNMGKSFFQIVHDVKEEIKAEREFKREQKNK